MQSNIEFIIYSDNNIDFHSLEKIIGIQPTEKYIIGDEIRSNLFRKDSAWIYVIEQENSNDLVLLYRDLMCRIKNHMELAEFCKNNDYKIKICFALHIDVTIFPVIHLKNDFFMFCNTLNACFEIPVYI